MMLPAWQLSHRQHPGMRALLAGFSAMTVQMMLQQRLLPQTCP